jgi:hypothetical protein
MFCWSLFVLLYLLFLSFCCLFFFDMQILITLWYLQTLLKVQRSKFDRNDFRYYETLPLYCLSSFHCIVCHPSIVLSVILLLYFLSSFHNWLSITLGLGSHNSNYLVNPRHIRCLFQARSWFSTSYVVVFFVFSEFSEGETRVVDISCVDERHCLTLFCHSYALFWEMREHTKSVIESHIWKDETLRLGRTPRRSGPEIKSKKYDGYQHNIASHPLTKRR